MQLNYIYIQIFFKIMRRYLLIIVYRTELRKLRVSKSVKANSTSLFVKCICHSLTVRERRTLFTIIYGHGAKIVSGFGHYVVSPRIDIDTLLSGRMYLLDERTSR